MRADPEGGAQLCSTGSKVSIPGHLHLNCPTGNGSDIIWRQRGLLGATDRHMAANR